MLCQDGANLQPVYPSSGCGFGHSEEKRSENDRALPENGGPASPTHEDPQNSVWLSDFMHTHLSVAA